MLKTIKSDSRMSKKQGKGKNNIIQSVSLQQYSFYPKLKNNAFKLSLKISWKIKKKQSIKNQQSFNLKREKKEKKMQAIVQEYQKLQSQSGQSVEGEKICFLTFYHPKLINKTVPVRNSSFLYEFRSVLSDGTMLKLFQNYQFLYNKQVLSEMTPLSSLLPQSEQQHPKYTIDIRLVAFDQRTAKYHLKQVYQVINNPILYQLYQTYKGQNKQLLQQIEIRSNNLNSNILMNQNLKISPNINDVLDYNLSSQLLLPHYKVKKPQLVQFVSLSGFNPPPPQYRLDGNLFYLHVRVLESVDYHITASPEGFFVNQSKISQFNPTPVPNKPVYASLFDLIRSLSEKFQNKLEDFLAQNKLDESDKFLLFFKTNNFYKWQQKVQHQHTWNSKRSMLFYLKQLATSQLQDWNESFHLTDRLTTENNDELQSFDTRHKLYKNFQQAAIDGATMLIDGKIAPLNPLQEKKKQIYIHNKIFFSIANQTPYNHSQQKGQQAAPSSSAINTDLINLQVLSNLNIKGLNVLHMILINYRGYKIIAQCIIPGILSAQQNLCSQYGSIDDGKTIQTNPEFEKLMIEVAEKLHLEDNIKVKDGNGVEKRIAISPDIKGILGSNQRKYILDLLRLSPRDLNYPEIENETCVFRPELIKAFKAYKIDKGEKMCRINCNIGTEIHFIENQDTQKQKELLEEMAKFIINETIPNVINSLKNNGSTFLTNCEGISQAFHEQGLNMRYLGKVYHHSELNNHLHIKIFLERIILTRCLKHLFRMAMRETNIMHMNLMLTRLLNSIFGQKSHIELLEEGTLKESHMQEDPSNKDGKKKKKKNKNNKQTLNPTQTQLNLNSQADNLIKIQPSVYLSMKPSELWEIVKKLAKARYDFEIKGNLYEYNDKGIFSLPYTKVATLQDLCTITGLVLEERSYNIIGPVSPNSSFPFHYKNIVNITPRSKHMKLPVPKEQELLKTAIEATEKYKIKEALQIYNALIDLCMTTNDIESLCQIYSRLGKIFYHMTEYQSAIVREITVLKIFQMGLRQMTPKVVQSYSKLGLYEMVIGNRSRALYFLHKSLLLMLVNYGQTYPDLLVTFANIARIYQQDKESKNAVNCYLKALQLVKSVNCKYHINISFCCSSLASLHYQMKQFKKAIEYQTESVATLCEIFDEKDPRLTDAKKILKVYCELAQQGNVYTPQQVPGPNIASKVQNKDKTKK